jgi:hypothetical protein
MSSVSLKDVQLLARHLIYWRRGRAIPPLRWRDTYIVSPNANMRILRPAATKYAARFPTLPSLPKMLQSLSGPPRPYFHLMPTKDHRAAYMEILAWLMRYGWVTQLRTFGWVLVSREVKVAVAVQLERERRLQQQQQAGSSPRVGALDRSAETLLDASTERVASPLLRPPPDDQRSSSGASPRLRASSDAASVSSGRTARTAVQPPFSPPARPSDEPGRGGGGGGGGGGGRLAPLSLNDSPRLGSDRDAASDGASPSGEAARPDSPASTPSRPGSAAGPPLLPLQAAAAAAGYAPTIVTAPQRATELEARWIAQIAADMERDPADAELRAEWPNLLKYLDGRHAWEDISAREGVKKKKVAAVLARLVAGGWVVTARHW